MNFIISKSKVDEALELISWNKEEKPKMSIHFNFNGYKPMFLEEASDEGVPSYMISLMVPPGSLNYFYSVEHPDATKSNHIETI
jgi:hypothetical protein